MTVARSTVLLLLAAMPAAIHAEVGQPAPATFCARLAPGLGFSPLHDADGTYWQMHVLNAAQRFLVGGTAMMGFHPMPVADASLAAMRRLEGMCGMEKKSLACNVVGPVTIRAQAGNRDATAEARPGEHARLWTEGARVRCRDLPTG